MVGFRAHGGGELVSCIVQSSFYFTCSVQRSVDINNYRTCGSSAQLPF